MTDANDGYSITFDPTIWITNAGTTTTGTATTNTGTATTNTGTIVLSGGGAGGSINYVPLNQAPPFAGQMYTWNGTAFVPTDPVPSTDACAPPIEKKANSAGCVCKSCKELSPQAEANQDDGSFVCYGCRLTW